jgi:hypothetical protein
MSEANELSSKYLKGEDLAYYQKKSSELTTRMLCMSCLSTMDSVPNGICVMCEFTEKEVWNFMVPSIPWRSLAPKIRLAVACLSIERYQACLPKQEVLRYAER